MKRSACIHLSRALTVLFLMFSSACQPAPAPAFPTPYPTSLPVKSTATDTTLFSLPTATVTSTATAQPTVTNIPAPLSTEGPWLIYNQRYIVNQDGTGRKEVEADCGAGSIQEDPSNLLVIFPNVVRLFQPSQGTWRTIYSDWPTCGSDFTGNVESGLLASLYRITEDAVPELQIHELPSGKLRDQFPLLKCPDPNEPCNTDNISWWGLQMKWSPNGRYLAFSAVVEGPSSDLYVYDVENRSRRRLTSGPDTVGPFWWSPDGSWIIMAEALETTAPSISSLWAVSVSSSEIRLLHSQDGDSYPPLGLFGWLDDRRFIIYDGTTMYDPLDLPASNLRLVDIDSGEIMTLFSGSFVAAELDPAHETLAFYAYDPEPREGYEGQGIYLVSTSNTTIRFVGYGQLQPDWDEGLGLFVTVQPCQDDPEGRLAFDYQGEWQCLHPAWPDRYPSPDGQWQVSIQDGTWLKTDGKQPVEIIQGGATQVIWRPDSEGFFLVADQVLYYVSLPQATPVVIDDVRENWILYQWLEGD